VANSATVGILRALLVADTADFEQKLGAATKEVGKLETALKDAGGKTVGALAPASAALDQAAGAATNFTKQLLGVETAAGAVATETAAVTAEATTMASVVEAFVGELLGPELGAIATGFAGLVLPITAAAAALGAWVAWIYQWTDLGPAVERLWGDLTYQVTGFWTAIQDAHTALGEFTTAFQGLIPGLETTKLALGGLQLAFDLFFTTEIAKIDALTNAMAVLRGVMGDTVVTEPWIRLGGESDDPLAGLHLPANYVKIVEKELTEETRKQARERDAIRRKEAAAYAALVRGAYALSTKQLEEDQQRLTREVEKANQAFGGLSEEGIKQVIARSSEYLAAGLKLTPAIQNVRYAHLDLLAALIPVTDNTKFLLDHTQSALPAFRAYGDEVSGLSAKYQHFNNILGDAPNGMARIFALLNKTGTGPLPAIGNQLEESLTAGAMRFVQGFPQLLAAATTGGGRGMGQALGAMLGEGISGAMSAAIKDALKDTSALNQAGAAMAAPIIISGFTATLQSIVEGHQAAKNFQVNLHKMTEEMHADLVGPGSPYEDFQALEAAANELGLTFVDVWNPDGVNTFGYHLQERIDEFKELERAAEAWKKKVTGAIDALGDALHDFGGSVPKSLRPMIETLLESKDLTGDMREALEGMARDPTWQTIAARAEALGIELADLGPKFQSARLHDIAFGFLHDLQGFEDWGVNMDGALRGMADELSTLYQEAKTSGVALPETLRPYMQRLIDLGLLVDDTGQKIGSLDGITFEDMEDTALGQIKTILEEIAQLLRDGLPRAAETGAEEVARAFSRNPIVIPIVWGSPGAPPSQAVPRVPAPTAPTLPGPVVPRIGDQGGAQGEYVDYGATAGGLEGGDEFGGGDTMTVIVEADGRQISRIVAPFIPGEVRRLGLARG